MSAAKIGRNDPCFCGSGKKYKFCCLGKTEPAASTSGIPFPTVSEEFALRSLLASSRPFHAFYTAERSKIVAGMYWTDKLPMPPGIEAQAIRLPKAGPPVIYLHRIPAVPTAALTVAHEMMHLVLDAEGFPFIASLSEHQPLAALLNSTVQDPLIDARLQQYGFDIGKKIQQEIKAALAGLQHAVAPLDRVTRIMWVLNYMGQLLECSLVAPDSARQQVEEFTHWFDVHHPEIAAEGRDLLTTVQRSGYDTPDRMRTFFDWITRRYRLADDFIVSFGGRPTGS